MAGGITLQLCILAGVSLAARSTPLLPQSNETLTSLLKTTQRPGKEPAVAQSLMDDKFEGENTLTKPASAPVTSMSPTAASGGRSKSIEPVNEMGRFPTDSWSPQMGASETSIQSSRSRSADVSYIGQAGRPEVAPDSIKERLVSDHEGLPPQTREVDDGQDGQMLKYIGTDTYIPVPGTSLSPGPRTGSAKGINQESPSQSAELSVGSLAINTEPPAILASSYQGLQASLVQEVAKDKAIQRIAAVTSVLQTLPGEREMALLRESKQKASTESHGPVPISAVPPGQVPSGPREVQMAFLRNGGPETDLEMADKVAGQAGRGVRTSEVGQDTESQLSKRAETGMKENDTVAERAEELATKHLDALSWKVTMVGSTTKKSIMQSGSNEEHGPRYSAVLDEIQLSTPSGAALRERGASPSPALPSTYLTANPAPGQNDSGETLAWSGPQKQAEHIPSLSQMGILLPQDRVTVGGMFGTEHPSAVPMQSGTEATAGDDAPPSDGVSVSQDGDLPLIFKRQDDDPLLTTRTSVLQSPFSVLRDSELTEVITPDADLSFSKSLFPTMPEGHFVPWQMSGTEISDIVNPSVLPPLTAPPPGPPLDYDSEELGMIESPNKDSTEALAVEIGAPKTTEGSILMTVAKATSLSSSRHKSGLEELESEEEHDDEDEEDEDTEESEEEESHEDLAESPTPTSAPHTYSHVPYHLYSNSIWVQRHQGLVRSWVEKIRDKVGYVSGMLAPVGIGIAGALFILGALYSIKVMHRKKRNNSFKHQRRKDTETNSRQDRVMLLADSSEDEF